MMGSVINNFHFIRPIWLLLLVPFVVLVFRKLRQQAQRSNINAQFPKHLSDALLVNNKPWLSLLPLYTLIMMGIMAIVVAAGPTWKKQITPFSQAATPLVIVLDLSESMMTSDVAPNRLFRAKQKILELLALRDGGVSSLVVFSGSAHLTMPLTQDVAVFEPMLNAIDVKMMPREGKFLEYTVPVIERALGNSEHSASILIISDAVSSQGSKLLTEYAKAHQYQVIVYGIGNPDKAVVPSVEVGALQQLATDADGEFVLFDPSSDDLNRIDDWLTSYSQLNIGESEPWFDSGFCLVWVLLVPYLLWARKGWLVQWCLLLTMVSSMGYSTNSVADELSWVDLWMTADQQGRWHYDKQDYTQAALAFKNTYWKAMAFYRAGDYDNAQQYFMREDTLQAQLGAAAALMHQKEYVAAKRLYQVIVEHYPENGTAQQNLALVTSIIKLIDQFSESQSGSSEQQASRDLGDKPQTSEGVEQHVEAKQLIEEKLTAEQILNSEEMNQKWMKRVSGDLGLFISNKFSVQLESGVATSTDWKNVNTRNEDK